jgi:hypothetical protein
MQTGEESETLYFEAHVEEHSVENSLKISQLQKALGRAQKKRRVLKD